MKQNFQYSTLYILILNRLCAQKKLPP